LSGTPRRGGLNIRLRAENGYRDLAEQQLAEQGRLVWLDWLADVPVPGRDDRLDKVLPAVDALISTPWLGANSALAMPVFDEPRFERAAQLKVIAGTYDFRFGWIDLDATERHGIAVVDTSRSMTPSVAEFGLAMTLNLLRDIPESVALVRRGEWVTTPPDGGGFVFGDLAERRVGLVGYGSINRHYRNLIAPFGCDVETFDPFVDDATLTVDSVRRSPTLVDLAARSEIFVVAIPPTPATTGLVNAEVIGALPRGSLFVGLSRMAVVQQDALWKRARSGELRAAVDVFDPEPPPSKAWLRTAANILPTPHIAGNTRYAHRRCFTEAVSDAIELMAGRTPRYLATRKDDALYRGHDPR
jgi:phosphoglycerate dehydrogenase-like enzyme